MFLKFLLDYSRFTLPFGLLSFYNDNITLATSLIFIATLLGANHFLMAKTDQLTELKSRRGMYEEMEALYTEAKEKNEPLCLLLCDIDYLKDINNRCGRNVGDKVIKDIAKEIQNSIRNTDCVSRWSGEEFLILLSNTERNDANKFSLALAQRIKNLKVIHNQKQIQVSLSIGVSDIENTKSIYAAIRHADNAMYQSKKEMTTPI